MLVSEMTDVSSDKDVSSKVRTKDVKHQGVLTFEDLMISPVVLEGLKAAKFAFPSPIQLKAIPLGRCGLDLIVQAKSGTGKTCVFAVVGLESISLSSPSVQVLILSPTREIAVQSQRVTRTLGSKMEELGCHTFIGGIHRSEDLKNLKRCQIAVGSPGRIKYLIEEGFMKTKAIRLLVLDEVDMLMTDAFQPTINWIFSSLPQSKQVLAVSATYTESMVHHLTNYMKNPTFVRLNASDPALLGIRQFYHLVPEHHLQHVIFQSKLDILVQILSSIDFQQCLVFSNFHSRTQELCEALTQKGWPVTYISGSLDQTQRIQAYDQLTQFQCRVLVSTDLTARGIDAENVNLVINLDIPWEMETYLHRIGRAGRFGSFGAAISLVSAGDELALLQRHEHSCRTKIVNLPTSPIPKDLAKPACPELDLDKLVSVQHLDSGRPATRMRPRRRVVNGARTEKKLPAPEEERKEEEKEEEETPVVEEKPVEETRSRSPPAQRPQDTAAFVEHVMSVRAAFKAMQRAEEEQPDGYLSLEDVHRMLEMSDVGEAVDESVPFSSALDDLVSAHLDSRGFSRLDAAHNSQIDRTEVGVQCCREIPPPACGDAAEPRPSVAAVEVKEEEEREEEEEEEVESEPDSELDFLYSEYHRLNKWAEFYSAEYERACEEYEACLAAIEGEEAVESSDSEEEF